jgi:plasmid stabilization system protein ParE
MINTIHWSNEAEADYADNIVYLLENWATKDALEFINNTADIVEIISSLPEAFPLSDYKDVRKAVVCKQISLFYTINKSEITLVRFWNNKQNPENFKK